ncbi:metallophosphoesterase [Rhizobium leguminosarum]
MKLWIFSDLHLEFDPTPLVIPEADVAVCAGDVWTDGILPSLDWLTYVGRQMPVVFVPGNHEFYYSSVQEDLESARRQLGERPWQNVHFLENSAVAVQGTRFVGTTLWTDYRLLRSPQPSMAHAEEVMMDFARIKFRKSPYQRFRPIDVFRMHRDAVAYLKTTKNTDWDKTVVVTHHAPSMRSIPEVYRNDPATPHFASDLEPLIHDLRPELWVHGHIHARADYMIGDTRVICNPRGYPQEEGVSNFDPGLIIDV